MVDNKPFLAILILNYNNYQVTEDCVKSIRMYPPSVAYQIVIIDNGSTNNSLKLLTDTYKSETDIVIIRNIENLGFAKGNNVGLRYCESQGIRYCVLTNSDVVFYNNSLSKLYETIGNSELNSVIVGPKIIRPDGNIQISANLSKPRLIDALEFGRLFPLAKIDEAHMNGIHKVHSVSGACFAVDIREFKAMGAFDENTFLYNEENILGEQAGIYGKNIYIDLDAIILHNHGASSGFRNDFVSIEYLKSTIYYWSHYRKASIVALQFVKYIYIIKLFILCVKHHNLHPLIVAKAVSAKQI